MLRLEAMRRGIKDAGAILLAAGQAVGGRAVDAGVALRTRDNLPEATRERLSSGDRGRRKRSPKTAASETKADPGDSGSDGSEDTLLP